MAIQQSSRFGVAAPASTGANLIPQQGLSVGGNYGVSGNVEGHVQAAGIWLAVLGALLVGYVLWVR